MVLLGPLRGTIIFQKEDPVHHLPKLTQKDKNTEIEIARVKAEADKIRAEAYKISVLRKKIVHFQLLYFLPHPSNDLSQLMTAFK